MGKFKLFIALPYHHYIEPETDQMIAEKIFAGEHNYEITDFFKPRGSPNVYSARYSTAQEFLKTNADYYLYLDADQVIEAPDNAIDIMIDDDKDLISPLIVRRIFPHIPACLTFERKRAIDRDKDLELLEDFRKYGEDKPFEVYYCCGGLALIKRKVLEKVVNPFYPVFSKTGSLLSTDYSFFYKARNCGFKFWIEPRVTVSHIGKYRYLPADYYDLLDSGMLCVEKQGEKYIYKMQKKRLRC